MLSMFKILLFKQLMPLEFIIFIRENLSAVIAGQITNIINVESHKVQDPLSTKVN